MLEVVFYTREGCCLCDDALRVVEAVGRDQAFALSIVDIDGDLALIERYGDKVPVLLVDGRLHAKYRVDPEAFSRRLRAPTAGTATP